MGRSFAGRKAFFCHDLPSRPRPGTGKILVTGASGYIGGRLVPELLNRGYKVRAMVRAVSPEYNTLWPGAEIAVADALEIDGLGKALEGIDTAYYLLHSLLLGPKEFELADIKAAVNFRKAAEKQGVKRIIYLGGLGDIRSPLSSHLRNRIEVAKNLKSSNIPVTVLRAAVIIGSGSASYEIIQHLVRRLPVILIPYWAKNRCQPISIRDIIKYLVGVLETPQTAGKDFDIGGRDVLAYEEMLRVLGEELKKKIIFVPFFFSNIRFFSYIVGLLTPVPVQIIRCLMEGLKNEVFCRDDAVKKFLPFETMSYKGAIRRAMVREKSGRLDTHWADAYPPGHTLALKFHELNGPPTHTAPYFLITEKSAPDLFDALCKVGGKEGWFHSTWLWRLRGIIDKIFLGIGTSRRRKSYSNLRINDVIGFWRVEDIKKDRRLLLRAEMKSPGDAWLEFSIEEEKGKRKLSIVAYYDTHTFLGEMYWQVCLPFHHFIFTKLLTEIEKRG